MFENEVKIIGKINFLKMIGEGNEHTILTIETTTKEARKVYLNCVFWNKNLIDQDFQKDDLVEINGEIQSYFNQKTKIKNQNVSILNIEKI